MFYWLLKYIFMGPILQLMGRPKVEGLENIRRRAGDLGRKPSRRGGQLLSPVGLPAPGDVPGEE